MTEKRFHIINDADNLQKYGIFCKPVVVDNETDKKYILALDLLDLLNTLHEENQELHKTINELDNCQKGQSHRINDLYLENKQLKDLITHLGYTIKYDGYRHISLELQE